MRTSSRTNAAAKRRRYVVAAWDHYFPGNRRREVRFAYDRRRRVLVAMQVRSRRTWRLATRLEWEDLADSLHHGNEDLIDDPAETTHTSSLPDWALAQSAAPH